MEVIIYTTSFTLPNNQIVWEELGRTIILLYTPKIYITIFFNKEEEVYLSHHPLTIIQLILGYRIAGRERVCLTGGKLKVHGVQRAIRATMELQECEDGEKTHHHTT